jgi:hypothetical protein
MTYYTPKTELIHDTPHYIVIMDKITRIYELIEKNTGEIDPVATHKYSVPLIVAANALEASRDARKFYTQTNVGTAKYLVNHHDGIKKHDDGSEFFDVTIFKNKKKFDQFVATLKSNGYKERH